jgi:hypothetical protein
MLMGPPIEVFDRRAFRAADLGAASISHWLTDMSKAI